MTHLEIKKSRTFEEIEADVAAQRAAWKAKKAAARKAAPKEPSASRAGHAHSAHPDSKRHRVTYKR